MSKCATPKVPTFSGELSEWERFRALFCSVVGDRATLSDVQKLYYLKASVTGDAALILNRVPFSDANFAAAWKLLTDEYDNVRNLVQAHLRAFVDFPIMKIETAVDIKRLRDTVSSSIALLETLKRPINATDDLLIYIITQKFSKRTRIEWNLQLGRNNECPTYKQLYDFLTQRIRGIADLADNNEHTVSSVNSAKRSDGRMKKGHAAVNNTVEHGSTPRCPHCAADHFLAKCELFLRLTIDQRATFIKRNKLCFLCLRPGHMTVKCRSRSRCERC